MTINITAPDLGADLKPRIVVVGVGGAGGNAVNNMIRSNLEGVEFIATNTDAQALRQSQADVKIQLGAEATQGLGAGARPEIGREAAQESLGEVIDHLTGANMVFITAGMGGGTGTGAAPVLAEACRDNGMLTVGVVTRPFHFEGSHRMRAAEQGIEELQQFVDTLIIIPNQNLFRVANEKTTFADAFKMADDVLYSGVRGVTDLMVMPGLINLDFADIRTVMSEMGKAMMGTGEAEGENRAIIASESAISNPLLEDVSMKGAQGVLINITGGPDMTLFEVDEAANRIREEVDADANIIFGSTFDENLDGKMRVSVVATGIESEIDQTQRDPMTGLMPLRSRNRRVATPEPEAPAVAAAYAETPAQPAAEHQPAAAETGEPEVASAEAAAPIEDAIAETAGGGEPASNPETTMGAEPESMAEPRAERLAEPAAETAGHTAAPQLFDDEPQDAAADPVHTLNPAHEPPRPNPNADVEKAPEPVRPRDAFIPPRPVRPEELGRRQTGGGSADPYREAELMNAGDGRGDKAKGRDGLFRRWGMAIKSSAEKTVREGEPRLGHQQPGQQPAQQAPQQTGHAPSAGGTSSAAAAQSAQQPVENRQDSLAPATKAEEEMLDIPAFLRRQAN